MAHVTYRAGAAGRIGTQTRRAVRIRLQRCGHKVRYRDHAEAVVALHATQVTSKRQFADFGATRRHESRVYRCERCCGYHLTSWAAAGQPSAV